MTLRSSIFAVALAAGLAGAAHAVEVQAISFANSPDEVYLPLREAAEGLKWTIAFEEGKGITLKDKVLSDKSIKRIEGGIAFIPLSSLEALSAEVAAGADQDTYVVTSGESTLEVSIPVQQVEINLAEQELRAFQGKWMVLRTHISSGRSGFGTPTGSYKALSKSRHRTSRKYNNAPMPYAVQIWGGYFIHGSPSVPEWPASHGCVRMPLEGRNPANLFFDWVFVGTKVKVSRGWSEAAVTAAAADA